MKLDIYKVFDTDDYDIVKNIIQRDWLDETIQKHGYKCLPVTSMNTHSWSIVLKKKTVVHWSPGEGPKDIEVLCGPGEFNMYGGFVSFQLPYIFKTEEDFYTVFTPSPNFLYKNATPLSFLIRSDWFLSNFQCAWKLHTPGRHVIEEGTPIVSFFPYPKGLIDDVDISIHKNFDSNEELYALHRNYFDYIELEYSKMDKTSFNDYPYIYKKGVLSEGSEKVVDDADWRPTPKKPERF